MAHHGQVEHDPRAVGVEVDVGGTVEHPPKRALQQLAQPVGGGLHLSGQLGRSQPGSCRHVVAGIGQQAGQVVQGHLGGAASGQFGDGPAHFGVLDRAEVAAQYRAQQGGHHDGLPAGQLLGPAGCLARCGVERVEPGGAAGVQLDRCQAEGLGQGAVLALRIGDGHPAAEDADRAVDEALYSGNGLIIVAPRTGQTVQFRLLDPGAVQAARRVLAPIG